MKSFQVTSYHRDDMIDITAQVQNMVNQMGLSQGICTVFIPHTTAAVTINENADPDVVRDIKYELDKIVPWSDGYQHFEGNTAAHIKSSFMGFSEQIILDKGRLVLGTWQGIYLCEFDGPRVRKVHVHVS